MRAIISIEKKVSKNGVSYDVLHVVVDGYEFDIFDFEAVKTVKQYQSILNSLQKK